MLGCDTFADFFSKHRTLAHKLAEILLRVGSWVFRRHGVAKWGKFPWKLAVVADMRNSEDVRRAVVQELIDLERRPCCLDPYFTRPLLRITSPIEFLSKKWVSYLEAWVSSVPITNCQVEFRHARQQCASPSKSASWTNFAIRSFSAEVRGLHDRISEVSVAESSVAKPACEGSSKSKSIRFQNALQYFHKRCIKEDRAAGRIFQSVSTEYWEEVRGRWATADAAIRDQCCLAAEEDKCQRRLDRHDVDQLALSLGDAVVDARLDAGALVEAGASGGHAVSSGVVHVLGDRPIAHWVSPAGSVSIDQEPLPLQVCTSYLSDQKPLKLAYRRIKSQFAAIASAGKRNSKVAYKTSCGPDCALKQTASLAAYCSNLMKSIARALIAWKQREVLLRLDCFGTTAFFFVCSWTPKTGNFAFCANMLECLPVANGDGDAIQRYYGTEDSQNMLMRFHRVDRAIDPLSTDSRSAAVFCYPFLFNDAQPMFDFMEEVACVNAFMRAALPHRDADLPATDIHNMSFERVGWDHIQVGDLRGVSFSTARSSGKGDDSAFDFLSFGSKPEPTTRRPQHRPQHGGELDGLWFEEMLGHIIDEDLANELNILVQEERAHDHAQRADFDDVDDGQSETSVSDIGVVDAGAGVCDDVAEEAGIHSDASGDEAVALVPALEPQPLLQATPLENRTVVLRTCRTHGSTSAVAKSLGVVVGGPPQCNVTDSLHGGALLGTLKVTFAGTTIQAKCSRHAGCKALLSVKPARNLLLEDVESDLVAWLAASTTLSKEGHLELLCTVKADYYGVRLRGR